MIFRLMLLCLILLFVAGCTLSQGVTVPPTATLSSLPPAPTLEPGWREIAPGAHLRQERVRTPYTDLPFSMVIVRLDPTQIAFRVHYTPGEWHLMHEWVALLKNSFGNPLMVVNANFFTETGHAVGLVVSDGQVSGDSLQGFGGMFLVNGAEVRVRSLVQEPYYGESYEQVAQGFPMLIEPGGIAASTGDGFDDPSRRTIIAQDFAGNILVMTTPAGRLTLRNAQRWLLDSGLNINIAFGLDGGKSSGLYFAGVENETLYPSVEPIPVIISAHVR